MSSRSVRDVNVEEIISLLNARATGNCTDHKLRQAISDSECEDDGPRPCRDLPQPIAKPLSKEAVEFSRAFWSGGESDSCTGSDTDGFSSDDTYLSTASAPVASATRSTETHAHNGVEKRKVKKKRRRRKGSSFLRGPRRSRVMQWVKQTTSSQNKIRRSTTSSASTCSKRSAVPESRARSGSDNLHLPKDYLDLKERRRHKEQRKKPWRPSSASSVGSNASASSSQLSRSAERERVRKQKKLRISQQYRAVVLKLREAVESYQLRNAGLRKSLAAASDVLLLRDDQIAALKRQVKAQQNALEAHRARDLQHVTRNSPESRVEKYRQLVAEGRNRIKQLTEQLREANARNEEFHSRLQRSFGLNVWMKQRLSKMQGELDAAQADRKTLLASNDELRTQIQQEFLANRSKRRGASAKRIAELAAPKRTHNPETLQQSLGITHAQPNASRKGVANKSRQQPKMPRSATRRTKLGTGRRNRRCKTKAPSQTSTFVDISNGPQVFQFGAKHGAAVATTRTGGHDDEDDIGVDSWTPSFKATRTNRHRPDIVVSRADERSRQQESQSETPHKHPVKEEETLSTNIDPEVYMSEFLQASNSLTANGPQSTNSATNPQEASPSISIVDELQDDMEVVSEDVAARSRSEDLKDAEREHSSQQGMVAHSTAEGDVQHSLETQQDNIDEEDHSTGVSMDADNAQPHKYDDVPTSPPSKALKRYKWLQSAYKRVYKTAR